MEVLWLIAILLTLAVYVLSKVYDELKRLRLELKVAVSHAESRAAIADFDRKYPPLSPEEMASFTATKSRWKNQHSGERGTPLA